MPITVEFCVLTYCEVSRGKVNRLGQRGGKYKRKAYTIVSSCYCRYKKTLKKGWQSRMMEIGFEQRTGGFSLLTRKDKVSKVDKSYRSSTLGQVSTWPGFRCSHHYIHRVKNALVITGPELAHTKPINHTSLG
jgi:hypothetical protein